ncbi:hypothetical protein PIB30_087733 [Stylosanthes scabra]|uniref:Xylanase inhibitor N-terminal domain-containing protein n=1 Tax=Stylosanthes scabra TaxID=79078 RepID=A0ABU6TU90_9FABA|nr:hypothetical protein [Stylosanthes scabra]
MATTSFAINFFLLSIISLFSSLPCLLSAPPPHSPYLLLIKKDPSTNLFYTTLAIGTPSKSFNLAIDLAGENLWYDCDKHYNSSSYSPISCHSKSCPEDAIGCIGCTNGPFKPGCTNNTCGGSNLHPKPVHVGPTHCPPDIGGLIIARVASPSFDANLPQDNDDRCDFDDNCSFGELAVAIVATPQPPSPRMGHADPEPLVEEALRCDDSDEEPVMIEGDSDDDEGTIPVSREVRVLEHSTDSGVGPADGGSNTYVHGSIGSSVGEEFQIGQTFQSKEDVLQALKIYSIRRGVDYKVFESDHDKYHGKCKEFGTVVTG